jgi:hypothetical protein
LDRRGLSALNKFVEAAHRTITRLVLMQKCKLASFEYLEELIPFDRLQFSSLSPKSIRNMPPPFSEVRTTAGLPSRFSAHFRIVS